MTSNFITFKSQAGSSESFACTPYLKACLLVYYCLVTCVSSVFVLHMQRAKNSEQNLYQRLVLFLHVYKSFFMKCYARACVYVWLKCVSELHDLLLSAKGSKIYPLVELSQWWFTSTSALLENMLFVYVPQCINEKCDDIRHRTDVTEHL